MAFSRQERALWTCRKCRRSFANRYQAHSCRTVGALERHFAGKPPLMRALFDRVLEAVRERGPVTVLPERTRIAFQVRMSFMAVTVQRSALHFVLPSVRRHVRFTRITTVSPRNHVHEFRLTSLSDVDATFRRWVAQAYRVGEQRHSLRASGRPDNASRRTCSVRRRA